jgi:SAM-dependent methyltransferase
MLSGFFDRRRMIEAWALHDAANYRQFAEALASLGTELRDAWVVDLGCGANAPMTLVLHALGIRVTGIDSNPGYRWGLGVSLDRYRRYRREAGLLRTARKAAGELVYDRHYYQTLSRALGVRLTERNLDIKPGVVDRLELAPNSVDVIHSNATWEHVPDVSAANEEVARVLRPGGLAYIEIHLFPSLSGGRESTFREQCERTKGLEVVDWRTEFTEGESLLDEKILAELPEFTPEELTKRSIIAIVRKRSN